MKERETTKARVPARGWLAGFGAKVSVLECGITISKPDVTFVGQWPRDDPFACNCVSFTTPDRSLSRSPSVRVHPCSILFSGLSHRRPQSKWAREKWFRADLSPQSFADYRSLRLLIDWCRDFTPCFFFSIIANMIFHWLQNYLYLFILNCS